jgi:uncharacterized protein (TIGR03437 family)
MGPQHRSFTVAAPAMSGFHFPFRRYGQEGIPMNRFTLAFLMAAPIASAQVLVHHSFSAREGGCGLTVRDFNGDGKADILYAQADGLAVALNNGDGTFRAPIVTAADHPSDDCQLAVADFNSDGKLDVITNRGLLFAGNGNGTFQRSVYVGYMGTVLAADFDRDGKLDLVFGTKIALGNGDGTFRLPDGGTFDTVVNAVGDFDGDGNLDLAWANDASAALSYGNGQGGFREWTVGPFDWYSRPLFLAAADLNRDGISDLIFGDELGLHVYLGSPHGLIAQASFEASGYFASAVVGDFDGDGNADVLLGGLSNPRLLVDTPVTTLAWYRGRSDGTFALRTTPAVPFPYFLAAGDLDGDGVTDAIVGSPVINSISVFTRAEAYPRAVLVSPASNADLLAPGAIATAYGSGWIGQARLELTDASGMTRSAPMIALTASQINFQIPEGAAPGSAQLLIHSGDGSTIHVPFQIQPVAPALFVAGLSSTQPPAGIAWRVEPNGTQSQAPLFICDPVVFQQQSCYPNGVTLDDRALYLTLYGTGLRASPDSVRCMIGDTVLPVEYAGPGGSVAGLDQINVRVTGAQKQPWPQRLTVVVNGLESNSVSVLIK